MVTVVVAAVLALVIAALVATIPFRPVTRARLYRFASRQSLPITVDNGALVLRYLATTRRWRGGGLLVSVLASVMWSVLTDSRFTLGLTALFAGWFLGAVIAEWRVGLAVDAAAGRRAALLAPRRLITYLPWKVLAIAIVAVLSLVVLECVAIAGAKQYRLELVGILVASLAIAAAIAGVARHVLHRAQPLDQPGVIDADDALRSRSLRVLVGSGIAIAGYLLSSTVAVAVRSSTAWGTGALSFGTAVGILVLPVVGALVALEPARNRRRVAAGAAA